jgi:hypothetical protein
MQIELHGILFEVEQETKTMLTLVKKCETGEIYPALTALEQDKRYIKFKIERKNKTTLIRVVLSKTGTPKLSDEVLW